VNSSPATPRLTGIGQRLRCGGAVAYGVPLISLLPTALAYYVRQNVEAHNRLRFNETSQATQEAIERRTQAYLDAMLGARGLFYASRSVDHEEWMPAPSTRVVRELTAMGYGNAYEYEGGKQHWMEAGYPIRERRTSVGRLKVEVYHLPRRGRIMPSECTFEQEVETDGQSSLT
jgi:3-mercaptopyruvate sulfurtransferase SseA